MLTLVSCMDKLFDKFYDNKGVKEIKFLNETWKELTRRENSKITYNNGFFVNRSIVSPKRLWLDTKNFTDHEEFALSIQAIINEKAAAPP